VSHPDVLIAIGLVLLAGLVVQDWWAPGCAALPAQRGRGGRRHELDRYESLLGVDQARYRDHVYLDQAPYQPLAAVGPLALHRLAGGDVLPADWGDHGH
jgi:hypothetical protein